MAVSLSAAPFDVAQRRFAQLCAEFVESARRTFGWEPGDHMCRAMHEAVVNPRIHDFRLAELPRLAGDAALLAEPRRILDFGSGSGPFVFSALGAGHEAHGFDLDPRKVALGRARVDAFGEPARWRAHLHVGDATAMPYDDGFFDIVTSYHVLEHVGDVVATLYEAVRVTKPGGVLELRAPDYRSSYDPHYGMAWPRFMPRRQAERWCDAMNRPRAGVGDFHYVTLPHVLTVLAGLGCEIVRAELTAHTPFEQRPFAGDIAAETAIFADDREIEDFARELRARERAGTLEEMYRTCLEFAVVARRPPAPRA